MNVKRGSVVVPIYNTPRRTGSGGWTVVYREPDGRRQRIFRTSLEQAKLEAEAAATRLANIQDTLVGNEAREASQARQLAEAAGFTLLGAVQDYCACQTRLAGKVPLGAVVDHYLSSAPQNVIEITLDALREEYLAQLLQDGRSAAHRTATGLRLKRFCETVTCRPAALTARLLDEWLRAEQKAAGWSGRTRNHYRTALSGLCSFAKRRGYLPRTWAELDYVPRATEEDGEIGVYTADELTRMLQRAFCDAPAPSLQPFLVLGAFAGCRPSEIQRLHWEDFHWETSELFVGKGKVRTAGHRVVPLLPACLAWLQKFRKSTGRVAKLKNHADALLDLQKSLGIASKHDGLRHSYVTYRRAITKNLPQVSGETGTDVGTLTRRYCRPVKQSDAEAWFNVRPC